MIPDDRLRAELEALEHAAPSDLPPRPPMQVRSSRMLLWAPAAVMVVAGLMIGIALPPWLDGLRPLSSTSLNPSSTRGATSAEPTTSGSVPPAVQLDFVHLPFPDAGGAILVSLANIEGRLILTGSLDGKPQAWSSDDDGATWERSVRGPTLSDGQMGPVAGTDDRLVSVGTRLTGANDAAVETLAWVSDDFGLQWMPIAIEATPQGASNVVWTGSFFMAVGDGTQGAVDLASNRVIVWTSESGSNWEQSTQAGKFGNDPELRGVATFDGRVAMLLTNPEAGDRIWYSDDAVDWREAELTLAPGTLSGMTAGPHGFVVAESEQASEPGTVIWRSPDATTWTSQPIALEAPDGLEEGAFTTWSITDGYSGLVLTKRHRFGAPAWFLPRGESHGELIADGFGGDFRLSRDATAHGHVFLAIWKCPATAYCGAESGLRIAVPFPDTNPRTITGKIDIDSECWYLQEDGGHRWSLSWPEGYAAGHTENWMRVVFAPDGSVAITPFDTVTVEGRRSREQDSPCGGVPYVVTKVVQVAPER